MARALSEVVVVGDAVRVLKTIGDSSSVMCYLDPPFLSQRSFLFESGRRVRTAFDDRWDGGIVEYTEWISPLLTEVHRVLDSTGSVYVHVDTRVSHYVKVILDGIFGRKNFRNEIIWKRLGSHNDASQGARFYGRIHDVILFYTKTDSYKWHTPYLPYQPEYIRRTYRYREVETGRRYALGDLSAPGGPNKGNPKYEFLGVTRYWRYSKERMDELLRNGRIVQRKAGNVPLLKRYFDEVMGKPAQDVWDDIDLVRNKGRNAYPTQKPQTLLERLIYASTDPGDLLIDPLCGSGTSLLAAHKLGRKWLGVDSSKQACQLALGRLRQVGVESSLVDSRQMLKITEKA
jgi:DNA modification methylase